jgi:hypothetical protein
LITKAEACKNARAVLAGALDRIARDYAAGRLSPADAEWVEERRALAARGSSSSTDPQA